MMERKLGCQVGEWLKDVVIILSIPTKTHKRKLKLANGMCLARKARDREVFNCTEGRQLFFFFYFELKWHRRGYMMISIAKNS